VDSAEPIYRLQNRSLRSTDSGQTGREVDGARGFRPHDAEMNRLGKSNSIKPNEHIAVKDPSRSLKRANMDQVGAWWSYRSLAAGWETPLETTIHQSLRRDGSGNLALGSPTSSASEKTNAPTHLESPARDVRAGIADFLLPLRLLVREWTHFSRWAGARRLRVLAPPAPAGTLGAGCAA
jgi:hypothetical protein